MADDITKMNTTSAMAAAVSDMSPAADTREGADPFADTKEELLNRFELLPDDIKAAMMDSKYQESLFNLAKAQKLTYEELGILETETTMVLLGMTKPAEYRDELQAELKKNDADIDVIVKAVNEQVFAPVRSSLERVYANRKEPGDYLSEEPEIPVKKESGVASSSAPTSFLGTPVAITKPAAQPVVSIPTAAPVAPRVSVPLATAIPINRSTPPSASLWKSDQAPVSAPSTMTASAPVVSKEAPVPTPVTAPAVATPAYGSTAPRFASQAPMASSLTSAEKNVLGAAGVVINQTPTPVAPVQTSEIPDRANLLASIENPSRIAPNIIADKLKTTGPVISATRTTDYSMPAKSVVPGTPIQPITPPAPTKPYVDPYREPI